MQLQELLSTKFTCLKDFDAVKPEEQAHSVSSNNASTSASAGPPAHPNGTYAVTAQ